MFYTITIQMQVRQRRFTTKAAKELAVAIYSNNGMIRSFSNEGILRPYMKLRDQNKKVIPYCRYWQLQVDMSDENLKKFVRVAQDHPDVLRTTVHYTEIEVGAMKANPEYTPLDTFVRREEEINWPPQVSADVYDQLDMNWKEFSKSRWSDYLRE